MTPPDEQQPPQDPGAPPPADVPSSAEETRSDAGAAPAPEKPLADDMTAQQKLADPVTTGAAATDPAASIEKPVEAAAPAPEGAQPADAAAKAEPPATPAAERPARPPKEVEPKTAPREAPPPDSIFAALTAALPGVSLQAYMVPSLRGESVAVEVSRDDLTAVMTACREDARLSLDYLRSLSGIDWQDEGLEVVYHLWSMTQRHALTVKTRVTYADASVPSVAALYPAADWHERETRDMFGINFEGHWNLVPLLLPEDMTDHFPLRKDNPLQEIEEWQGENLREGAGDDGEGEA